MFNLYKSGSHFTVCLPRRSIPGPDHLSTLSTTIELLQLLLPEDSAEVIPDQEDESMEGEPLKRTTEISISAAQMGTFLKFESEDGPLKTLEKRLEVCGSFFARQSGRQCHSMPVSQASGHCRSVGRWVSQSVSQSRI